MQQPGTLAHAAIVALAIISTPAAAQRIDPPQLEVIHPWQGIDRGLEASFSGTAWVWYGFAAMTTPPLVWYVDRPVQDWFQEENPLGGEVTGQLALYIGGSLPALLPLGLYLGGLLGTDAELATAGAAALQAGLIQLVLVTSLKWLTDRAGPYPNGDPDAERWHASVLRDSDDPSDFDFNPFNLKWGLRWPSGHTASMFTMVSALVGFYPDRPWIAWVGFPIATLVGLGMIEGDYHWLSDVTAGAMIGLPIGLRVGREFRRRFDAQGNAAKSAGRGTVDFALGPGCVALVGSF